MVAGVSAEIKTENPPNTRLEYCHHAIPDDVVV
jgi:hypothetical protein